MECRTGEYGRLSQTFLRGMDAEGRATQEQLPSAAKGKREREHVYEIFGLGCWEQA